MLQFATFFLGRGSSSQKQIGTRAPRPKKNLGRGFLAPWCSGNADFLLVHREMYAMIAVSASRQNAQADVLALHRVKDGMQAPKRASQACLLG